VSSALADFDSYLSGSGFLLSVLTALAWPFSSKQKRLQTFGLSKGHPMQSFYLLTFQGFSERGKSSCRGPGSEMVPWRVFTSAALF